MTPPTNARVATVVVVLSLFTAASAFAGFAGTDLFLPSVGNRPGNSGSQWYTLLWIYNPGSAPANVRVWFLQRNVANPSPLYFDDTIPAGGTNRYPDVITDKFHVSLWGALRITSPSEVVVTCRMYNLPPGGGDADTQGQDYAGVPASFAIGSGQLTELLGVYQTTPLASSVFRYSFGWVETTGGTANVRVTAFNEDGTIFTHKDYPTTLGYEARYYDISDLIPNVNVTNERLKVEVTGGSGKVVAVGSGAANTSNDGTTFEMQFADSLLGGGLSTVSHDGTLTGDGTSGLPLGIADNGVTSSKIASGQVVKGFNNLTDVVTLAQGSNVTITPSGNTLTIAATGGGVLPTGTVAQTLYNNGSAWIASSALTNDGTNVGISGNLSLPGTTSGGSAGVMFLGGERFLHNFGPSGAGNTFVGQHAGNFSMTGTSNTASGYHSLSSNITGGANTASGLNSLSSNTTGFWNTASGYASLLTNTTGSYNTAIGAGSLQSNSTGYNNTASGYASLYANTTGASNIAVGYHAGNNLTTGSYNIDIGNAGNADEANTIRIGTAGQQTNAYIAGIYGMTIPGGSPVVIDSTGHLGSGTSGGGGITGVTAGTGLTGGGTSGNVTLGIANGGVGNAQLAANAVDNSKIIDTAVTASKIGSGQVVKGLNGLHDNVNLSAGSNVTITPSGNTLTIAAAAGGLTLPWSGSVNVVSPAFAVTNSGTSAAGLYGASASGYGVAGFGTGDAGIGVYGQSNRSGAYGYLGGNNGYGVVGIGSPTNGFAAGVVGAGGDGCTTAAIFNGVVKVHSDLDVDGTIYKGGGGFKIDDPLDPANKYLSHSFVESPDMKNVYDGVVTTDGDGRAVVQLPAWFGAVNRDFRYQLTVIGRFAQAIVEEEIANNRFTIRTNLANVKVSWQVTGIRQDAWANAHRIPVEEAKPAVEQGTYLHPELFGQPEEKGAAWARMPELMKQLKAERAQASKATPSEK